MLDSAIKSTDLYILVGARRAVVNMIGVVLWRGPNAVAAALAEPRFVEAPENPTTLEREISDAAVLPQSRQEVIQKSGRDLPIGMVPTQV